jgi:outer membrane protein TolC
MTAASRLRSLVVLVPIAVLAGCATAVPDVNGVAAAPPSPAAAWVPPTEALTRPPHPRSGVVPADIVARVRSLTLGDVIDLALRNNPVTRVSWAQARAAAATYGSTRGGYLPSILGSVTASRNRSVSVNGGRAVERSQLTPSLQLNYLLLDFGGRAGTVEEARQNLFAADLTHNATLQSVILQVESAYFTYMANSALLDAQKAAIAEARANLASAQQRDSVGLATIADVLQARTALSQEQLSFETIQGSLQIARGDLAAAMGVSPNLAYDVGPLPESPPVEAVTQTVDSLIGEAVARRPDLAAARASAASAAAAVRVTRSAGLPSLALGSTAGRSFSDPAQYGGNSYGITLGLSVPLFTGFSHQYDVAAARARADAAAAQADVLTQQVATQVFTSYYALQTAGQKVATASDYLASAVQSEQVAAGRYREGVGSIIDLLTAQSALANARAQQVQSRWQWYTALAQLAHDAGVLGPRGETPFPLAAAPDAISPTQTIQHP